MVPHHIDGTASPSAGTTELSTSDSDHPQQTRSSVQRPLIAPRSRCGPHGPHIGGWAQMSGRQNGVQADDGAGRAEGRRGLVMVSDTDLLDAVLRTAAAAGCEVVRALDPTEARRTWPGAPIVVLDPDAARTCADGGLPRRRGVVVAVSGEPPPEAWKHAVAVGADHVISLPEAEPWLVAALAQAAEGAGGDGAGPAGGGGRGRCGCFGVRRGGGRRGGARRGQGAARRLRSPGWRGGPRPRRRG